MENKLTTERLKEIIANAPEGANGIIQVDAKVYYTKLDNWKFFEYLESHSSWVNFDDFEDVDSLHSLSDIKEIIELREMIEKFESIVSQSEGVAGFHQNGDVALWGEFEL